MQLGICTYLWQQPQTELLLQFEYPLTLINSGTNQIKVHGFAAKLREPSSALLFIIHTSKTLHINQRLRKIPAVKDDF